MSDAASELDRLAPLALPPSPPDPPRAGFPWIAAAAPVAGAVAIWAITGSALSLAFAVLGPVVAVATMLDSRRSARRERRARARSRRAAIDRLREEVLRRHGIERVAEWRAHPTARATAIRDTPAWLSTPPETVVVGTGIAASRVGVDGDPGDDADAAELVAFASRLTDAPVRVAVADGIGFAGPGPLARAAARAVVVQCAASSEPGALTIEHDEDAAAPGRWGWLHALPHRGEVRARVALRIVDPVEGGRAGTRAAGGDASPGDRVRNRVVAVARVPAELPPGLGAIVEVSTPRGAVLRRHGAEPRALVPELLGGAEARRAAERLADAAERAGIGARGTGVADVVGLATVLAPPDPTGGRSGLRVAVGRSAEGLLELDLVEGPHALVAGTSGSGKSEFLVAWVAAIAARFPPDRVAFLLVDFKGGAAFAPVAGLVHTVGVVTDLHEDEAARAVDSLGAELRHRERVLAGAGARSLAELPPAVVLPRLVVVVDEFQAMIARFPELGGVIADIAARGRSLGVHLVLASQRPNGVVREQVTANCGLRISMRVIDRADSIAVVGVDLAAGLDPRAPGRAVADPGDGRPVEFQSALADDAAIAAIARRHAGAAAPRRPWLDPLPAHLAVDDLPAVLGPSGGGDAARSPAAGSVVIGVTDEPAAQRRGPAVWTPGTDGPLLVLGAPGSGRSALLAAITGGFASSGEPGEVVRLSGPRSRVWDDLEALRRGTRPARLVVIDDLDIRLAGWPDDHRLAAFAMLEDLLGSARRGGPAVALAAARSSVLPPGARDAVTTVALLRQQSRADLVHAGGDGSLHRDHAPPGAGQWRGLRAQFLQAEPVRPVREADVGRFVLPRGGVVALVTRRAVADAVALARAPGDADVIRLGDGPEASRRAALALEDPDPARTTVIVGDAEAWAVDWNLASRARSHADVLVHGGPGEYRALIRDPALPPLLDDDHAQCWWAARGETVVRLRWIED